VRQTELLIKKQDPLHKKPKALPIKEAVAALRQVETEQANNDDDSNIYSFPRPHEEEAEEASAIKAPGANLVIPADGLINDIEHALSHKLGLNIRIRGEGEEGDIIISYSSLNELETLLRRLERATLV